MKTRQYTTEGSLRLATGTLTRQVILALCGLLCAIQVQAGNPPIITSQPQSQTLDPGQTLTLAVQADGPIAGFKWMLNGDYIDENLLDSQHAAIAVGAQRSTLTIFNAQATDGGEYSVMVYNDAGSTESRTATVIVRAPALAFGDYFSRAGTISGISGVGSGDNSRATRESSEPIHDGKPGTHSLWINWVSPKTGFATIRTDGTAFDSVLGVYTGNSLSALTRVASDDDGSGYHTSLVQFPAVAGATYRIAVDSFGNDSGSVVLSWHLIPTLNLPPKVTQFPLSTTVLPGSDVNLRLGFESPVPVKVQWYQFDEPIPGATGPVLTIPNVDAGDVGRYAAKLDNGEISFFTEPAEVQINTEGSLGALAQNKQADAAIGGLLGSLVNTVGSLVNAVGGLLDGLTGGLLSNVAVDGVPQSSPSQRRIGLSSVRATKHVATAMGYSGTQIFSTYPGKDSGEPNHCGARGGSSYWLGWQAPESGQMSMNTSGSSYSTILAVYYDDGRNLGYSSLVSVGCSYGSSSSSVSFYATGGRTYYIVVDGMNGAYGRAYLNYNLNTPPTISSISNQTIQEDSSTAALSFTVSDKQTSAGSLSVSAYSSNPNLVPNWNISLGGSGSSRSVTVRPAANKSGSATITVYVSDGGASSSRSFTVNVSPVADAPVASGDSGTRYPNTSIQFAISKLLSNDMDPDGDAITLGSHASKSSYGGTISRSGNYLVYYPPSGFNNTDYFTYTISDGKGGSATATVTVYVSSSYGTYTVQ